MNKYAPSDVEQVERALVAQASAGARAAQEELFVRHRDAAFRAAFRITGRHEDALDVVQDSFVKAFARLSSFHGDSSFKTWLLRIVANQGLDLLRKRKLRLASSLDAGLHDDDEAGGGIPEPAADGENAMESAIENSEAAARVQIAVDRLPPEQKAVFAMYATGDMTYGQIAESLGVPIGTVMSRLFHARRKLRELLPDLADEAGSSDGES
ncbi:MAG: sigma-70 family RNA polymerase sigma factor [Phycisphaerae bacterium]|nr:sigma-70 family RNA polymerase sigma factor [Phycisphaerae bacterium]